MCIINSYAIGEVVCNFHVSYTLDRIYKIIIIFGADKLTHLTTLTIIFSFVKLIKINVKFIKTNVKFIKTKIKKLRFTYTVIVKLKLLYPMCFFF